jgi:Protein of unknown function (DUF1501)
MGRQSNSTQEVDVMWNRREFLCGAAGALAWSGVSVARSPHRHAVVQIHLTGGPSQLDTFDPKPDSPSHIRGPFGTIPTRTPGLRFTELFPRLAALSHRFTVIHSLTSPEAPVHEIGLQLANTGLAFGSGPEPTPRRTRLVMTPGMWDFGMPASLGHAVDQIETTPDFSTALRSLKKLSGWTTIYQHATVFDTVTWDCHSAGGSLGTTLRDIRDTVAPRTDAALAEFITRLHETGELAHTLVLIAGEFGRTPKINGHGGRDHWTGCWSAIVAGAGVPGGQVIGSSDADAAYPKDQPTTPADLLRMAGGI